MSERGLQKRWSFYVRSCAGFAYEYSWKPYVGDASMICGRMICEPMISGVSRRRYSSCRVSTHRVRTSWLQPFQISDEEGPECVQQLPRTNMSRLDASQLVECARFARG
jgi:hypothetical protein